MNNRLLFCLVLLCLVTNYSECWRSSGRSGGRSRSSGRSSSRSSGGGWFSSWGSSKHSSSSSSHSSKHGSSSSHNYPSSSSGLSGSSGSKAPSYPPSISGLSGSFGSSSHNYPSSSSGLSGSSGSSSHNYPSSSSGLSGSSGSKAPSYPSSNGLSGSSANRKPIYPTSSGMSGTGSQSNSWGTNSGNGHVKYPSSTGLSGGNNYNTGSSGSVHQYPSQKHSYNTNANPNPGWSRPSYNSYNYHNYVGTPQYIYLTEYKNSNSRYSDLLTGLALYNLGRSHSHYHHHYYHDDYYSHRYSSRNTYSTYEQPKDRALCTLKIKENNNIESLKIPCEIVSTFTEGSNQIKSDKANQNLCDSNITVINNTQTIVNTTLTKPSTLNPSINISKPKEASLSNINNTVSEQLSPEKNMSKESDITVIPLDKTSQSLSNISLNSSIQNETENATSTIIKSDDNTTTTPRIEIGSTQTRQELPINVTTVTSTTSISNITTTNTVNCPSTIDPLKIVGPPINATRMDCEVEILTKQTRLVTKVDCTKLIEYSKKPEPPKKESTILPDKSKLKSWLSNPPWWMSIFIAV